MTEDLRALLNRTATERAAGVPLVPASVILREARAARRRRRLAPVIAAAAVIALMGAVAVPQLVRGDRIEPGPAAAGASDAPSEARLRETAERAVPPRIVTETTNQAPNELGPFTRRGRTGTAPAVVATIGNLTVEWFQVDLPVDAAEIDALTADGLTAGRPLTKVDNRLTQTAAVSSQAFTYNGYNEVYAWSEGGGVAVAKGGSASGPRDIEVLLRRLVAPAGTPADPAGPSQAVTVIAPRPGDPELGTVTLPVWARFALRGLPPTQNTADLLATQQVNGRTLYLAGVVADGQGCTVSFWDSPDLPGGGGGCGPAGVDVDLDALEVSSGSSADAPPDIAIVLDGTAPPTASRIRIEQSGTTTTVPTHRAGPRWQGRTHFIAARASDGSPVTVTALDATGRQLAQISVP